MAKKKDQGPSQAEKIEYLVSRGIEKRKDLREAKPAYIDRFYREAQFSDTSGETFSRSRARGHPPKVIYHPPNERMKGRLGTLEQWSVGTPPTYTKTGRLKKAGDPASIRDIPKLQAAVGPGPRYYIAFLGLYRAMKDKPLYATPEDDIKPKALSYLVNSANLADALASTNNIVDFANRLSGHDPDWTVIYMVSMREAV